MIVIHKKFRSKITNMTTEKKSYALPIAMMFALFFMIAFVTGLPSPMGVIVAKQFGASSFESNLGFFANFIAYGYTCRYDA